MKRTNEFSPETLEALIALETGLALREPETMIEPSKALDARVASIEPHARAKRLSKRLVRLLVAAAVILALTVTAAASPAVRQFVLRVFGDHTQVVTPVSDEERGALTPGFIPDGFAETERSGTGDAITVRYEADGAWFTLTKAVSGGWFGIDTEETPAREFDVNGVPHVAYSSEPGVTGVIRYDGGFVYAVSGSLDEDTLTRIVDEAR